MYFCTCYFLRVNRNNVLMKKSGIDFICTYLTDYYVFVKNLSKVTETSSWDNLKKNAKKSE